MKRLAKYAYPIFRIVFGLLFLTHGLSKITGEGAQSIFSTMGFVGLMEVLGGIAIAVGLFTRLAALGGVILMILAYVKVHLSRGILPTTNGGELAVLYLFAFYLIMKHGAGQWSLEKALFKKEIF